MIDDSETIAMRVTVIGGEPNADHHCPDEPKRKPRAAHSSGEPDFGHCYGG
jgi:hypothetical protein